MKKQPPPGLEGPECSGPAGPTPGLCLPPTPMPPVGDVARTLPAGEPGKEGTLSQSEPVPALALERCEWPSVCVCTRTCAHVWWGGRRNLDFRGEENNVVEGVG